MLLDEGRVIATGTHDELLATNARYREVLAAAGEHAGGVFRLHGRMIDAPVLAHAREVLRQAGADDPHASEAVT